VTVAPHSSVSHQGLRHAVAVPVRKGQRSREAEVFEFLILPSTRTYECGVLNFVMGIRSIWRTKAMSAGRLFRDAPIRP